MATVNFLYRSTKDKANLSLRLLFRLNEIDYVFGGNTKLEVTKEYWSKQHTQKRPKDIEISNRQTEVNTELNKIENHIIDAFKSADTQSINKEWLQNQINYYYNPPQQSVSLPTELIKYIDKYKELVKNSVTHRTIQKCDVIKQLLIRYQNHTKKILQLTDIDGNFKTDFENYCLDQGYAPNTNARTIRFIKTFCKHAKQNGLTISPQIDNIKVKYTKVDFIYLTFEELKQIEEKEFTESRLDSVKDWLIISCYTGQRVSDFLKFNSDQIRHEDGEQFIEFTQKKTGKEMSVCLHPKVIEILNKRNGAFPPSISDQKYNDYIKEVCQIAKINQKVKGSRMAETAPESKIYRKETGIFEKWELVTSHIGRRSYASNFYGKIPTSYLINVTGHSTEVMFLNYIGKSNNDKQKGMSKFYESIK